MEPPTLKGVIAYLKIIVADNKKKPAFIKEV
jgi:hypothetical protein